MGRFGGKRKAGLGDGDGGGEGEVVKKLEELKV